MSHPYERRGTAAEGRPPHTRALFLIALSLPFAFLWLGPLSRPIYFERDSILDALWHVEAAGRLDPPDGDGGASIGPYQIGRPYWTDAVAHDPALGGSYRDVRDKAYAERVIDAYMQRWAPQAWANGHAEVIARIHNGGPTGVDKAATDVYWDRVRRHLIPQPDAAGASVRAGD